MSTARFTYVIVGAGLAGVSACEGIREIDRSGTILLIGDERHLPYHRPPLSKKLWSGKKRVDQIFVHDEAFFVQNGIERRLGVAVRGLDAAAKTAFLGDGQAVAFERLLLATGGRPRPLALPGLTEGAIRTYRTLDDYLDLQPHVGRGTKVAVIGGGFIGLEMAAALTAAGADVTLLFPEALPLMRLLPAPLAAAVLALYRRHGVTVHAGDAAVGGRLAKGELVLQTRQQRSLPASLALAGIGLQPEIDLARGAGLAVQNGIVVDSRQRTSAPSIYAAGDNAQFPYPALGRPMRVEHWDQALTQGRQAGRNMAGADAEYDHLPYFFSDLFEIGFEAVGDIDATLTVHADWQEENRTGVLYYLRDGRVDGVLLCNVWERIDAARDLIRSRRPVQPGDLSGAIR